MPEYDFVNPVSIRMDRLNAGGVMRVQRIISGETLLVGGSTTTSPLNLADNDGNIALQYRIYGKGSGNSGEVDFDLLKSLDSEVYKREDTPGSYRIASALNPRSGRDNDGMGIMMLHIGINEKVKIRATERGTGEVDIDLVLGA